MSNVEILTADELLKWKIVNYPQRSYDISGIFPKGCDAEVISDTIKNLRGVVDAEVIDTYSGSQIPSGSTSVTIRYKVIEEGAALSVEKLLKGFGSEIR